jgi:hypothetical protein
MAETRPLGEQILFKSSKTGDQILDAYLEACEQGSRTLPDLIQELFDSSGNFQKLLRVMGNWAAATPYEKLDVVTHNNSVYICTTNHTSTGEFDASKFTLAMSPAGAFSLSSTNPVARGTAAPGVAGTAARADHVHPAVNLSSATEVTGTLPLSKGGVGGTTQSAAQSTLGVPPATRNINTDGTTLSGGGNLSADRTLSAIMPLGQCQLVLNGSNLELRRFGGRFLFINGKNEVVPTAAPSLAPTGLQAPVTSAQRSRSGNVATVVTAAAHGLSVGDRVSVSLNSTNYTAVSWAGNYTVLSVPNGTTFTYANTGSDSGTTADNGLAIAPVYYIYAYMSGASMLLEASPKAPMQDTTYGHMIKNTTPAGAATADATRVLVGMARVVSGPAWADSATQRFVLSYFNRRDLKGRSVFSANRNTGSATPLEPHIEARCEFLMWGDEKPLCWTTGYQFSSGPDYSLTYIGLDGASMGESVCTTFGAQGGPCRAHLSETNNNMPTATFEGYHFSTIMGHCTGLNAIFWHGGASTSPVFNHVIARG